MTVQYKDTDPVGNNVGINYMKATLDKERLVKLIGVKFAIYFIQKVLVILKSPDCLVIADQDTHGLQAGCDLACLRLKEGTQVDILYLLEGHIGGDQGLTVNFYT